VFLADNFPNTARPFKSFTGLYQSILSTKYEQPWWGGNYISFSLIPTPDGGLTGGAGAVVNCELRVDGGGLFQFCSAFQNEIERARQRKLDAGTLRKLGFCFTLDFSDIRCTAVYTTSTAPPVNPALVSEASAPSDLPPAYTI